jgi:hypothetical protein
MEKGGNGQGEGGREGKKKVYDTVWAVCAVATSPRRRARYRWCQTPASRSLFLTLLLSFLVLVLCCARLLEWGRVHGTQPQTDRFGWEGTPLTELELELGGTVPRVVGIGTKRIFKWNRPSTVIRFVNWLFPKSASPGSESGDGGGPAPPAPQPAARCRVRA